VVPFTVAVAAMALITVVCWRGTRNAPAETAPATT
jgi:hypothetical protein